MSGSHKLGSEFSCMVCKTRQPLPVGWRLVEESRWKHLIAYRRLLCQTRSQPMAALGPSRLVIRVSGGTGEGPTRLAAFDTALQAAGIAGYNIVRISSVIPPRAVVQTVTADLQVKGGPGDVAYCVYAAAYASTPGEQAWAGMAWAYTRDGSGVAGFVRRALGGLGVCRPPRSRGDDQQTMSLTRGHLYRATGQTVISAPRRPSGLARWSSLPTERRDGAP